MIYTSGQAGLGKIERKRLSKLLRNTQVTISVKEASKILDLSRSKAAILLAKLVTKGWLTRIYPGIYLPVPIESESTDFIPEDKLVIAEKLFSPCYIAGWSAAEYLDLTDQIFQSVIVMVQKQYKNYSPEINGTKYLLHHTKPSMFFGLKIIWHKNVKLQISDPTRTIVDLMNNPYLGGGIRQSVEILKNYFNSDEKSIELIIEYMEKLNKGSAYKRLGFLVEKFYPVEKKLIENCKKNLKTGTSRLDTSLECDKLVTRWQLWVPNNWK